MKEEDIIKIGQIKLIQISHINRDISAFVKIIKDEASDLTEERINELANTYFGIIFDSLGGRKSVDDDPLSFGDDPFISKEEKYNRVQKTLEDRKNL